MLIKRTSEAREAKNRIEYAFRHYIEWKRQIEEQIEDAQGLGLTAQLCVTGGGTGDNTSTTERAICNIESAQKALWCRVVEQTINYFMPSEKYELFKLRYLTNVSIYDVCERLHIGRSTMFVWTNELCNYAFLWATQLGLLSL